MKKLAAIVTAAALAIGMTACGGSSASTAASSEAASSTAASSEAASSTAASSEAAAAAEAKLPKGTIQMIIPFKAGGGTDLTARVLIEAVNDKYGSNIVAVNNTDGGGAVAYNNIVNGKNDGSMILFSHSSMFGTYLAGGHDVNPGTDLKYATAFSVASPYYLDVHSTSQFQTIQELVDYCKAHPGEVTLGVQAGSMSNYIIAEFAKNAGIEFKYVETGSGDADRVAGLLGDLFDVSLVNAAQTSSYIESGDLRALCALSDDASMDGSSLESVPDLEEAGMTNGVVTTLMFVACAQSVDDATVQGIGAAFQAVLEDPEIQQKLLDMNMGIGTLYDAETCDAAVVENYDLYYSLASDFGLLAAGR